MKLKIEYLPIASLKPYKKNTRKHGKIDVDNIAKSIKKYGMNDAIGIWGKDNIIVEGHGRVLACKQLGIEEVPCVRLDHLSDKERREYSIAHNATAELSNWDFDFLKDETLKLDLSDFDFKFDLNFDSDINTDEAINNNYEELTEKSDDNQTDEESDKNILEQEEEFKEKMQRGEIAEEDEEYQEFLQKFELKKTTDDCYTPDSVYNAAKKWCLNKYNIKGKKIIRPFYPGGDYKNESYPSDCVVIDNPPFSIISEICEFYNKNNIKFFLFAPTLTLLGIMRGQANYVACGCAVTYENGANVNTSFVTNLGNHKIIASSDLRQSIDLANKETLKKIHKDVPKYVYPDEVLTSTTLCYIAAHGANIEIDEKDLYFIRALDSQKEQGKGLYGSGFLLSKQATNKKVEAYKEAQENASKESKESKEKKKTTFGLFLKKK